MFVVPHVCALVVLTSTSLLNSARVRQATDSEKEHSTDSEEEPPPLGGCAGNLIYNTCCCFVDYGILEQKRCTCTSGATTCAGKSLIQYGQVPSRPIKDNSSSDVDREDEKRWHTSEGYVRGYQAVGDDFCKAAPVIGPQIDSFERSYECACSNSMSQIYEMDCGSGCDVASCKRSQPITIDWTPFLEGRGQCCLSSYYTTTEGCKQEIDPITEDGARVILKDALQNAMINGTKAFVPETSESLLGEMTRSFKKAKEKQMSTSRSGAQFFFSGDYKHILKSIHRPEYLVLDRITYPLGNGKVSLVDHIKDNNELSMKLQTVWNCLHLVVGWIPQSMLGSKSFALLQTSTEGNSTRLDPALRLSALVTQTFYGSWDYDVKKQCS